MNTTLFPLTLLFLLLAVAHAKCLRADLDTSATPSFICHYQVNVTHRSQCSTRVSERIYFPHFTEPSWTRQIKLCPTQYILNDSIAVRLKGSPVNFTFLNNDTISVPTPQNSTTPVWFRLLYQVRNGVTKYGEACQKGTSSGTEDSDNHNDNLNLIRWTLQNMNKTIDTLSVRFRTKYTNATLFYDINGTVASHNGSDITLRRDNVTGTSEMNFDVYENGSLICTKDPMNRFNTRESSSGTARTALVFGITIGSASIVMCLLAVFCARGSKADYRVDQKADDDDVVVF